MYTCMTSGYNVWILLWLFVVIDDDEEEDDETLDGM